jgi:hypothetical protein
MKTAELTGALLDYWVAKAEGASVDQKWPRPVLCNFADYWERFPNMQSSTDDYEPSTNWDHGGPIIDRERIRLLPSLVDGTWRASYSRIHTPVILEPECVADTALIAAMRAYVASKFGDEVPDELQNNEKQ